MTDLRLHCALCASSSYCRLYFKVPIGFSKRPGKSSLLPPFLGRTHPLSMHYLHSQAGRNMLPFYEFWGWFYLLRSLGWFINSQQSAVGEDFSLPLLAGLHISVNRCLATSLLDHARELLVACGSWWHVAQRLCEIFHMKPWLQGCVQLYWISAVRSCCRFPMPARIWVQQCRSLAGTGGACCVEFFSRTLVATYQQHAVTSPDRFKPATVIENMYFWKEKTSKAWKMFVNLI